jgi:PAS domain S-box-containing protein
LQHSPRAELLSGPYNRDYALRRWKIGQRHLEIGLDQVFVQAALSRLRAGLLRLLAASWQQRAPRDADAIGRSLNLLLDLELAKIQDAYHREHLRLVEEHTRHQGEAVFQALVEAAPCIVIITRGPDQTILYFNPFAEKVSGYTAPEVLGTNLPQLLDGPHLSAVPSPEHGTEFEGSVRCKDGSRRRVVWNSARLTDFHGQPADLFVGLDQTELKEAQQRTWQAERLAELGVLASGLAHEIRNPLNTIRFNLLNLQDGIAQPQTNPSEVATMVTDIADEVNRLEVIMRDFLRLARPDPAEMEAVDIRDLLERVARLVEGPRRAQNVELSWDASPDALAMADPNQLKQVLLNLVLNAQQAMPQGGRLSLRGLAPADAVLIEVADTGSGIPEDVREKLFRPFFSTKKAGTGLGLSICRRLVEQMHGRLDFTTQPGRGTTFVVRLPRAAP